MTAAKPDRGAFRYDGFASPNYTQIPDDFFDVVAPNLAEAELRVLLYLMRRTFGFKKDADTVSLKQLVEGIRKRDGTVLDLGTGMSKSSVVRGLAGLEEKGLIVANRNATADKGDLPTTYAVRIRSGTPRVSQSDTGSAASGTEGVALPDTPRVALPDTQQTASQHTVLQEEPRPLFRPSEDDLVSVDAVVADVAAELRDEAVPAATRHRAREVFEASGLTFDEWLAHVDYARRMAKRAGGDGQRSRMPAFWRALEGRLGVGERRSA